MKRLQRPIWSIVALGAAAAIWLPGCYTEVVRAKGPGAAAYDDQIRNANNYSGLPFDDATKTPTRSYGPNMVGSSKDSSK